MFKVFVFICAVTVSIVGYGFVVYVCDCFVVYVFRSLEVDGFRVQAVGMFQRVKF